jgi:phage N-6-adenine-methyltransferase
MSKVNNGMMTSNSDEWETPEELYQHYWRRFCFDGDVCATQKNTKHPINFYTKEQDGLKQDWWQINWMNPPYGSKIGLWIKKAYEESLKGNLTVCLLPARTDTKWWHDYVVKADSILYIKGRLKFGNQKDSAPFPSAIVIFGLHYIRNGKIISPVEKKDA